LGVRVDIVLFCPVSLGKIIKKFGQKIVMHILRKSYFLVMLNMIAVVVTVVDLEILLLLQAKTLLLLP
jgi:hypothetical protein